MDYNQEHLFRMQQYDVPRMPFYMSYPMQNLYLTEMEYEKDMERMKELYPRSVKKVLEIVEDECDKMEYEGSLMFDEYPDRMRIERLADHIYELAKQEMGAVQEQEYQQDIVAENRRPPMPPPGPRPPMPPPPGQRPPEPRPPMPPPPGPRDDLRDLIGVLLNNEMYKRRCRHRRCRRWW
ncbi:MAG: hypothetical protein SPJ65_05410 [Roseburia sp.]|nr:hypothetical protein [Roseburia sp.]